MTTNFAPWRKNSQRLARGAAVGNLNGIAAPRRRTPSSMREMTIHGSTTSSARCLMMAKHLCFGPVSGLEVRRALTPEKPWLTSSIPSMAFSWQTQNGVKQPRAKAQTTSKLALGTGRRTGGMRPRSRWPKPWLSTRKKKQARGRTHHHCASQNLARPLLLLQHHLVPGRVA